MNGYKILEINDIANSEEKAFKVYQKNETNYIKMWNEQDIKNIVTHEQFASMQYKVEVEE